MFFPKSGLLALSTLIAAAFSAPAPPGVDPSLWGVRAGHNPAVVTWWDPNDPSYINNDNFREEMIRHHNRYRREHGVKDLVWDPALADVSAGICGNCAYGHSHAALNGGPYGENIAAGFGNVQAVVQAWGDERDEYALHNEYANPTFRAGLGHFTQIVWAGTERFGCARKKCVGAISPVHESWYVVCQYHARGNIMSVDLYRGNVFPPVGR